MKKILLTLFAVAAIVACDKDDMYNDSSSINVLQEAEEIGASVDLEIDAESFINGLANSVTKEEIANYEASKLTKRTGAANTEWLHVVFFTFGSSNTPLAYLRSDDTAEICAEGGQISVIYTLETAGNGNSRLKIERIDGDGTVRPASYSNIGASLRTNYATLFSNTIDRVYRANPGFSGIVPGTVPSLTLLANNGIDFVCGPVDEWINDGTGLWTNPVYPGYSYRTTTAPFPLSGFLATIVTKPSGDVSANYAGTGMSDVTGAIETDIENGN